MRRKSKSGNSVRSFERLGGSPTGLLASEDSGQQPGYFHSFSAPCSPMGRKDVSIWEGGEASSDSHSVSWGDLRSESPDDECSPKSKGTRVERMKGCTASRPVSAGYSGRVCAKPVSAKASDRNARGPTLRHSVTAVSHCEKFIPLRTESPLVRKLMSEYSI